jgi:hypothetical protein
MLRGKKNRSARSKLTHLRFITGHVELNRRIAGMKFCRCIRIAWAACIDSARLVALNNAPCIEETKEKEETEE